MSRLLGTINSVLGILFLGISAVAIRAIPNAFARYEREPEDLTILGLILAVCLFVGIVVMFTGVIMLAGHERRWFQGRWASRLLLSCVLLLFSIAGIGFASNKVSSIELRLAVVPAVVVALSSYHLWKSHRDLVPRN